jgi:hypothetical protein
MIGAPNREITKTPFDVYPRTNAIPKWFGGMDSFTRQDSAVRADAQV